MAYTRHDVTLPTGPLSYYKAGSGRPVLYLHSGTGVRFTEPLDKLAEHFTVYMPIFPGYDGTKLHAGVKGGKALAQVFLAFVDTVIKEKTDVIGHSIGGYIAAWLAVMAGDKIDQLVLVGTGGLRPKGSPPMPTDPKEMLKRAYVHPENIKPDNRTPEVSAKNRETAQHYSAVFDEELAGKLKEITAITLIIHGEKEGIIPEETSVLLRSRIKTSYMIYLYDAAHVPEVDQPQRFFNLVGDFLTRGQAFLVNKGDRPPAGVSLPS